VTDDLIIGGLFGLFGLAFGSFLNVCIHRLPRRIMLLDERDRLRMQDLGGSNAGRIEAINAQLRALLISRTRSRCPHCSQAIAPYDNVPLLSWIILRGRCRNCRAPISPRYIVVEALTAALFVACYAAFDDLWMAARFSAFCFFLVGLIFTDAEWKLLPDALTLPGLVFGLLSSLAVPLQDIGMRALVFASRPAAGDHWRLLSLAQSAGGALAGAAFIYGAGVLYMRMRPDLRQHGQAPMGLGDVKLMAMIGAFLGVTLTAATMFAASLAGAMFGILVIVRVWLKRARRRRLHSTRPGRAWNSAMIAFRHFEVPFGVFLGVAAILASFYGEAAIRWYAGFFS